MPPARAGTGGGTSLDLGEHLSGIDVMSADAVAEEQLTFGDTVSIVVGSSSQALHRMLGSVAVSLARHSTVPVVIVP